jgi:hypothetical protein
LSVNLVLRRGHGSLLVQRTLTVISRDVNNCPSLAVARKT